MRAPECGGGGGVGGGCGGGVLRGGRGGGAWLLQVGARGGGRDGRGVGNGVAGTLYIVGIACLIGVPLGVGAGVYLAEKGDTPLGDAIRFTAEALSGAPSLVAGRIAYGLAVAPTRR